MLIRASIIIFGSLALSLVFKALHPILAILIVFSLLQIAEDSVKNAKEIANLNKAYAGKLREEMVSYQKQRIVIDIFTTIGWFAIAAGAFYLSLRFLG
jgi:hypothetical protein